MAVAILKTIGFVILTARTIHQRLEPFPPLRRYSYMAENGKHTGPRRAFSFSPGGVGGFLSFAAGLGSLAVPRMPSSLDAASSTKILHIGIGPARTPTPGR